MLFASKLIFVLKFITYPSECNDEISVRSKVVAQIFDMRINGSVISEEVITPDIGQKLVSRKSNVFVLYIASYSRYNRLCNVNVMFT